MSNFLQLALILSIFITMAKLGGYISLRLGQPSVLGEIVVGILLGPSLLNVIHWAPFTDPHLEEFVAELAELGVLLLMFLAGLELHLSELARSGRVSVLAGTLGVVFPVGMGFLAGLLFQMPASSALFLGLILAATSVSISAQTLMELGALRSRVGMGLLGAAVFDDVLVVLLLSIVLALMDGTGGGLASIGLVVLRMVVYLAGATVIGLVLLPRIARRADRMPISEGLVASSVVLILLYAWAAEVIGGMADITGAFLAGLFLARSPLRDRIETGISALAYGVFVPIFFIHVGLSANVRELAGGGVWLALALIAVAVVSKVVGAGLGAFLAGFSRLEALQLGAGMMSRGEVGLIVATLGITQGFIGRDVFSAVVGVVIATTLLTPPALRVLFARGQQPASTGDHTPAEPVAAAELITE
ncbi:MAG: cation:proton antiporter [Caldilineales bacterium]|nr:cation:proton antiporter [Caldilineales bacterium]MDW8316846.1 cation:proton antiporter [Anaerolineae bacterium]